MKLLSKLFSTILAFCFLLILSWFSFQSVIANDKKNQFNIELTPNKEDNETTKCLTVEYPTRYRKYTISVGVINAKALNLPKPKYPYKAKAKKISGDVTARVLVDETGKVIWARIDNGHSILQNAVKKVVCQPTFKPATISGNPYAVNGIIIYRFKL